MRVNWLVRWKLQLKLGNSEFESILLRQATDKVMKLEFKIDKVWPGFHSICIKLSFSTLTNFGITKFYPFQINLNLKLNN